MVAGQILIIEAPLFPMQYMRITQGINGPVFHEGTKYIDLGGKDTGRDPVYAPSEVKIIIITKAYNAIIFESTKPVYWADGSYDYYHMELVHDSDITGMAVGQVYKQGEKIYDEGGKGPLGTRQYASHLHLGVGRGKYAGKIKNLQGRYELKNEVEPYKLFWINGTTVLKDMGYPWKTLNQ